MNHSLPSRTPPWEPRYSPNEGKLIGLPKGVATRRLASQMGQAGRTEATWQKMGIGGCGPAAPPIGEGFVDYPVYYSTLWGKGVGRASERRAPHSGDLWYDQANTSGAVSSRICDWCPAVGSIAAAKASYHPNFTELWQSTPIDCPANEKEQSNRIGNDEEGRQRLMPQLLPPPNEAKQCDCYGKGNSQGCGSSFNHDQEEG